MEDQQKFVEKLISLNPKLNQLSMNSFEYRLLMLLASCTPSSVSEYSEIVEVMARSLFGLVMAAFTNDLRRREAFDLLYKEWIQAMEEVKND
jgi:TctA family transporter